MRPEPKISAALIYLSVPYSSLKLLVGASSNIRPLSHSALQCLTKLWQSPFNVHAQNFFSNRGSLQCRFFFFSSHQNTFKYSSSVVLQGFLSLTSCFCDITKKHKGKMIGSGLLRWTENTLDWSLGRGECASFKNQIAGDATALRDVWWCHVLLKTPLLCGNNTLRPVPIGDNNPT